MNTAMAELHNVFHEARKNARKAARQARGWIGRSEPWKVILAFVAAAFVVALILPIFMSMLLFALVACLAVGWVHEFVYLMRTPASAFPGRHDRLVWTIAFLLLAPLAFPAYWMFRHAEWESGVPWQVPVADKPEGAWDDEGLI